MSVKGTQAIVKYEIKTITAYWVFDFYREGGYTEYWAMGTTDDGRSIHAISCPFRLDIFDAVTEDLIKMRFDDDVQRENYEIHRQVWEASCLPWAQAMVAAFAALKG